MFKAEDLEHLDPVGESEEEYIEEQRRVHLAQLGSFDSLDEDDMHIPSRAEFRGKGIRKAIHDHEVQMHSNSVMVGQGRKDESESSSAAHDENPESIELGESGGVVRFYGD
jgi:hypothetical protein